MDSTNLSNVESNKSGRFRGWYFVFCLFVACLTVSHSASAQQAISIPLGPAGTLSYQVTSQRIPCTPNGHWFAENYQFSNFVYTDPSGATHPLSGSTFYTVAYGDNRDNCPPEEGLPIQITGQGYTIFFTPTSAGGGTGIFSALINPLYEVSSVLYAPPGNTSSSGYTSGVSNGTTTSTGSNYSSSAGISIRASGGIFGKGSVGVSFSWSNGNGTSESWQETTQNTTGEALQSKRNPVDHTQDQFFIWLNPQLSVVLNGPNVGNSTIGTPPSQPMDVININAQDLMNPSQIPLAVLLPQSVSGQSLPGLASICANPLPVAQCTQANACGCTPSDFRTILAQDPLIGTTQTTLPDQVDSQRYKLIQSVLLEGPQCVGCDPLTHSYSITDSNTNVQTQSSTKSYTVGVMAGIEAKIPEVFSVSVTENSSWTWTDTQSTGVSSGSSIGENVTLGSTSVDCQEAINVYEDTVYHTFAFAPSAAPPSECN